VNIVDFFIVGNKLSEDGFFFNVPNGACGIDGTGSDEIGYFWIPVE
jgi:hypothetical protein